MPWLPVMAICGCTMQQAVVQACKCGDCLLRRLAAGVHVYVHACVLHLLAGGWTAEADWVGKEASLDRVPGQTLRAGCKAFVMVIICNSSCRAIVHSRAQQHQGHTLSFLQRMAGQVCMPRTRCLLVFLCPTLS
jgi:hypothetical protein